MILNSFDIIVRQVVSPNHFKVTKILCNIQLTPFLLFKPYQINELQKIVIRPDIQILLITDKRIHVCLHLTGINPYEA